MPTFHSTERGTSGHAESPIRSGLIACQTSTNGWPTTSTCRPIVGAGDLVGDPALLRAGHEVVDQHADPTLGVRGRSRVGDRRGRRRRRGTRRRRPRGAGRRPRPSRPARRRAAPRRRSGWPWPPWPSLRGRPPSPRRSGSAWRRGQPHRRAEDHWPALEQEARAQRERAAPAAAVLEGQRVQVTVDRDDLAAPVGGDLLDDRAELGHGLDRAPPLRGAPVGPQDVGTVAVEHPRSHTQ